MLKLYCKDKNCLPVRSNPTDAGLDLRAAKETIIYTGGKNYKIPTGIHVEIPEGYVGLLFPRSGLAAKRGLRLSNCVGVIDSDYRGEVICLFYNDSPSKQIIKQYDRIAQLVVVPCVLEDFKQVYNLEDLNKTERGEKGFGSTGTA